MKIRRLAVIGVGLIGGSYARALRQAGIVDQVIGCGRGEDNLEKAVELGVIDSFTHDVAEAVTGADLVFISVPLGAMQATFAAMKGSLSDDVLVTDAGSTKGSVLQDIESVFGEIPPWFVPGHPIAGTESSGVEASFAELYQGKCVILTPVCQTDIAATAKAEALWRQCGADVSQMAIDHHDEILAATSHLPHMLAFGLVDTLARMKENDEIFRYAAGGFRDFTRIASSSPVMWRDICIANREALSDMLSAFASEMEDLAITIRDADSEHLLEIFERAKAARDRFIEDS